MLGFGPISVNSEIYNEQGIIEGNSGVERKMDERREEKERT